MACTTYMRSWQDFSYVTLVQLPLFLFSATFYPISVYPESLQWVVRLSPLYHSAQLLRELTTGIGRARLAVARAGAGGARHHRHGRDRPPAGEAPPHLMTVARTGVESDGSAREAGG